MLFKKFLYILTFALLFSFASCRQNFEDISPEFAANRIKVSLTENSKLYVLSQSSRTIMNGAVDFSDASADYHFYLWARNMENTVHVPPRPIDVAFDSSQIGTFYQDFASSNYLFTLVATKGALADYSDPDVIMSKAILVGYSSADLRYTDNVLFCLGKNGLTGTCTVDFTIYPDSTWSAENLAEMDRYVVHAGIYRHGTDTLAAAGAEASSSDFNTNSPIRLRSSDLPNGTLDFRVTFTNIDNPSLVNTYEDDLISTPNLTITQTIYIPNVIEYIPDSPENFLATYVDAGIFSITGGEINGNPIYTNADPEYYNAVFTWDDVSETEDYYRLSLMELSLMNSMPSDAYLGSMTNARWETWKHGYSSTKGFIAEFSGDVSNDLRVVAGNLTSNSKYIVLALPLGKCYLAKLEAVNSIGNSVAVFAGLDQNHDLQANLDSSGSFDLYEGQAFRSANGDGTYSPYYKMNRYKIVYNIGDGRITYNNADSSVTTLRGAQVEFHTQGSVKIMCPTASYGNGTVETPALTKIGSDGTRKRWTGWKTVTETGAYYSGNLTVDNGYAYIKPDNYTGYETLYLYAVYEN